MGGVYLEGESNTSIFHYNNDSFILYRYADRDTIDTEVQLRVRNGAMLTNVITGRQLLPLYVDAGEAVFPMRVRVGKPEGWHITRSEPVIRQVHTGNTAGLEE